MAALRMATSGTRHVMDRAQALESAKVSVARTYYPDGTRRLIWSRLATPAFHEKTSNILCPTMILHGDADPIFPLEHGQDMARRIPNSRLEILQGAGHNHPVSLVPEITDKLTGFLSDVQ